MNLHFTSDKQLKLHNLEDTTLQQIKWTIHLNVFITQQLWILQICVNL